MIESRLYLSVLSITVSENWTDKAFISFHKACCMIYTKSDNITQLLNFDRLSLTFLTFDNFEYIVRLSSDW